MVWGWIKRTATKIARAVTPIVSIIVPPVFNDQIDDIRERDRILSEKVNELNNNYQKMGSIQSDIDANITVKNNHERDYIKAKKTYQDDKYPEFVRSHTTNNEYRNNRIPYIKDRIAEVNSSIPITKDMIQVAKDQNSTNSARIASTYESTIQHNKDMYFGMNRTNNTILKTINNIKNKETTGNSKVKYLNEQMDTVLLLNYILIIIYIILFIIVAFSLYKQDLNISTLHKIYILVFVIIYPFVSIIYNKYIYKAQILKYYG